MDPCQTVQQIADYASPAGSVSPSVQGQSGWAVQRRAARNHWRLVPQLFSDFRPIANRGQQ